jgi:hypothetical protein
MVAKAFDWLKNWKYLKIFFFRTSGLNETKFGPNSLQDGRYG